MAHLCQAVKLRVIHWLVIDVYSIYIYIYIYIYRYIYMYRFMYPHEWLIFMVNVGKYYTSPMDPMGPSKMECHISFANSGGGL